MLKPRFLSGDFSLACIRISKHLDVSHLWGFSPTKHSIKSYSVDMLGLIGYCEGSVSRVPHMVQMSSSSYLTLSSSMCRFPSNPHALGVAKVLYYFINLGNIVQREILG